MSIDFFVKSFGLPRRPASGRIFIVENRDNDENLKSAEIGETIRFLRERQQLRQGDLAKKAGMSQAQLCHIEKARGIPSVRTLRRIADALGVPLSELTACATPPAPDATGADAPLRLAKLSTACRAVSNTAMKMVAEEAAPQKARSVESGPAAEEGLAYLASLRPAGKVTLDSLPRTAAAQVRRRILEYRALEGRAGVPTRPSLPLDYPAEIGTDDAEALARAVRRAGGIADAVLFDSISFLEAKGIRVVMADLPEGVDAFALWDPAALNAWLAVRKGSTDERQQFRASCAFSELLRFVAAGARSPMEDSPNARSFDRSFAAAFLMPEAPLRELCYRMGIGPENWTWPLLLREKRRFSVSAEAFAHRLESLGLMTPGVRQTLLRRLREWYAETNFSEPSPSHRQALRHSRFSDLKMLVDES